MEISGNQRDGWTEKAAVPNAGTDAPRKKYLPVLGRCGCSKSSENNKGRSNYSHRMEVGRIRQTTGQSPDEEKEEDL